MWPVYQFVDNAYLLKSLKESFKGYLVSQLLIIILLDEDHGIILNLVQVEEYISCMINHSDVLHTSPKKRPYRFN